MNYVHLGGIQILVKSTFKEEINCPIVVNLSDERFINAREGDLKEIILQLIIDEKYREEFEFSVYDYCDEIIYLDTSDYYFSE